MGGDGVLTRQTLAIAQLSGRPQCQGVFTAVTLSWGEGLGNKCPCTKPADLRSVHRTTLWKERTSLGRLCSDLHRVYRGACNVYMCTPHTHIIHIHITHTYHTHHTQTPRIHTKGKRLERRFHLPLVSSTHLPFCMGR